MSNPIPFGVFAFDGEHHVGALIHDATVLDLGAISVDTDSELQPYLTATSLDPLLRGGKIIWDLAISTVEEWAGLRSIVERFGIPLASVRMMLPFSIADYVDFFSSKQHAVNLSRILRAGHETLDPNWLSLPVGYHGRSGSVIASGTDVRRPRGQQRDGEDSSFGPSQKLDVEVEVGFVVGTPSPQGGSGVSTEAFEQHVFGVVLVNDWSARDIQAFEAVPLGPMLAKSFATSIAAWVYPLSAFRAARVAPVPRERPVHPYLRNAPDSGFDIALELSVNGTVLARPQFRDMYWTPDQQLAHLTSNGGLRTGDFFASGTVSSDDRTGYGSLIEVSYDGKSPIELDDGTFRTFLVDHDEVVISATAPAPGGGRFSLGEVRGRILPAHID